MSKRRKNSIIIKTSKKMTYNDYLSMLSPNNRHQFYKSVEMMISTGDITSIPRVKFRFCGRFFWLDVCRKVTPSCSCCRNTEVVLCSKISVYPDRVYLSYNRDSNEMLPTSLLKALWIVTMREDYLSSMIKEEEVGNPGLGVGCGNIEI